MDTESYHQKGYQRGNRQSLQMSDVKVFNIFSTENKVICVPKLSLMEV